MANIYGSSSAVSDFGSEMGPDPHINGPQGSQKPGQQRSPQPRGRQVSASDQHPTGVPHTSAEQAEEPHLRTERPQGAAEDSNEPRGLDNFLSKPWWLGVSVLVAVAGVVVTVLALPSGHPAPQNTSHSSPIFREEKMVSSLIAGDDYVKLQEIIGTAPDVQNTPSSDTTIYQFNRPWEYIDLLVKNGEVLSVGVYARTTRFKTTLDAGGYPVALNGPSIERQAQAGGGFPMGAISFCTEGDAPEYYYESISLPEVNLGTSFALGWVMGPVGWRATPQGAAEDTVVVPYGACIGAGSTVKCAKLTFYNGLSSKLLNCIDSVAAGRQIQQLSPSAVVVTAPYSDIIPSDILDIVPAPFSVVPNF